MKPHEQEWTRRAGRSGVLDVSEGLTLEVRCDLSFLLQDEAETLRRIESTATLAESAPDMARALRRLYMAFPQATATEEETDALTEAKAALRKAGVL